MKLKFKKKYFIGISIAVILLIFDIYFFINWTAVEGKGLFSRWFWPMFIIALSIGWSQFWIDFFAEQKRQKEIELKFLEFVKNIVETVRSGVSIPKSIARVSKKDYGALSPYIQKLSHQIEWGIPIHKAFLTFGRDTYNPVIKRSISIIIEADEAGGDIADVLESVAKSVMDIKKMKEERKSTVYGQIVQGYIVFFVFIGIMLVLQLWLFPKLAEMAAGIKDSMIMGGFGSGGMLAGEAGSANLNFVFFMLIMIQGFFAGIMIGKFSEGTIKQGLMHSLVLITLAALIITTATGGI